jgi:hypothetical protein
MKAKEIINKIAAGREYKDICRNIAKGNQLYEDLFQELIIILCEYDPVKLEDIYDRGQIKWFIIKILTNQYKSKHSPFHKKFRAFSERTTISDIDFPEDPTDNNEDLLNIVDTAIERHLFTDQNDWYETNLFKSYIEVGSLRKLSQKTGISRSAISYSVDGFKNTIKKKEKEMNQFMAKEIFVITPPDSIKEDLFTLSLRLNEKPENLMQQFIEQGVQEKIKSLSVSSGAPR